MASLEDMMPELAGVLAAQESALETVVATLTTHVRELLAANERQAQRVRQLEGAQIEARGAVAELQRAAQASQVEAAALAESQRRVEQELGVVHAESSLALERAVATAESLEGDAMKRLEAYVDERVGKARANGGQSLEEAAESRLELLEKKFDYLSRVKMEIKELTRTVEKQDQTIDGIKIGLEMLSKSIGADEASSDCDDDDDHGDPNDSDSDMSDVQLPVNEVFGGGSPPKPAEIFLSLERLSEQQSTIAETEPSHRSLDEKVRSMATPHAQIKRLAERRSLTLDVRHALEIKEASSNALTARGSNAVRRRTAPQVAAPAIPVLDERPYHREVGLDENDNEKHQATPVEMESHRSAPATQRDDSEADSNVPEVTPIDSTPTLETDEVGSTEESNREDQATQDIDNLEPSPAPEPRSHEHEEQAQVQLAVEEPGGSSPPDTHRSEQQEGWSTAPVSVSARSLVIPEEGKQSEEVVDSNRPADIPVEYRERTLSHQKQLEDSVALFRPTMSSSSASSTSRAGYPNSSRIASIPSASAVFRSRRQERNARRQVMLTRKESVVHAEMHQATARVPLSNNAKKEAWRRIFAKLIQLRRLHILSGASPEKSLFRKQNTSVGARVRRLEETAVDLEKAIELLEANIQTNAHGVQTLDELLSQFHLTTSSSVQTLALEQKTQSKTLIETDEKLEALDQEVRRMRSSNRRNSVQSSASTTTAMAAISVQVQHLSSRLDEQIRMLQAAEALTNRLATTDLPALQERADESLYSFRVEMERRLKEWIADSRRSFNSLDSAISETNRSLSVKMDGCFDHLYDDVLTITTAILRGAELVQDVTATPLASVHSSEQARKPLDMGIEMLEMVLKKFAAACNAIAGSSDSPDALLVAEQAVNFVHELQQLQAQATKAMGLLAAPTPQISDSASNNSPHISVSRSSTSSTKGFEEYLIQITATHLKSLEHVLSSQDKSSSSGGSPDEAEAQPKSEVDPADDLLMLRVRDVVIQERAVLFLLRFCRYASDDRMELQELHSTQTTMAQDLASHSFSLSQVGTTLAMVKLMSTRLDSFMELSYSFAKDDDVKKSVQELLSTSSGMRDRLAKQLEDAQQEAAQRDAMFERELNQLISRVNKKLDKDELLWTQEVLERQLQSVAKASLGEEDLVDIHRLIQHKLDKSQFNSMLKDQRAKMMAGGSTEIVDWLSGGKGGGGSGNGPLVGAKCISCQGELPPSKAMIKTVVKQEVQQEIAKAKTQHQVAAALAPPSVPAGFNASNHRNMEKFKTELLLSSLQKQGKK